MKKRIVVSAMAMLIGAGVAGSVTSTIAWYQYSVRTQAAYMGINLGESANLLMRIRKDGQADNEGWSEKFTYQQINSYLATTVYGSKMMPITTGAMDKDDALPAKFYGNPLAGHPEESAWKKVETKNYVVLPLQLSYKELNDGAQSFKAKEIYLTDLHISKHATDTTHSDISDAIRVHFSAKQDGSTVVRNFLASKKGGTTVTHGYLDLDADPGIDYEFDDGYGYDDSKTYIDYGAGEQVSFSAEVDQRAGTYYDGEGALQDEAVVYPLVAGLDANNTAKLAKKEYDTGKSKCLGSTTEAGDKFLNIDVTIWVEGWQKLQQPNSTNYSSVWDAGAFIASEFEVGFRFAVDVD